MPVQEGTRGHQACLQCADLVSLCLIGTTLGFPSDSVVKNPPGNAGDAGLIPVSGRTPGGGMATHSGILAWEISWTEEPGRLQSMELQKSQARLSN